MTNGSDRLDRIERILEELARSQGHFQEQVAKSLGQSQEQVAKSQAQLAQFQEQVAKSQAQFQEQVAKSNREMNARQQYHDEAFERHDAEMKAIREAIAADAENIRALVRIAELYHQRLERLEGEEPA